MYSTYTVLRSYIQKLKISSAGMCLVKGSPEAIGPLLATSGAGAKPAWFEATYTGLAEQGLRVLALACKPAPCGSSICSCMFQSAS